MSDPLRPQLRFEGEWKVVMDGPSGGGFTQTIPVREYLDRLNAFYGYYGVLDSGPIGKSNATNGDQGGNTSIKGAKIGF